MMLDRSRISSTGRYENPAEGTYEVWAVNGPNPENRFFLGSCASDIPSVYVALWEQKVWGRLLRGEFTLPAAPDPEPSR